MQSINKYKEIYQTILYWKHHWASFSEFPSRTSYVDIMEKLIENPKQAILYTKHNNKIIRNICRDIIKDI